MENDNLNLDPQEQAGGEGQTNPEQQTNPQDNPESQQDGLGENSGFDPEKVEFNGSYQFAGYDLSKFENDIELNENSIQVLDNYSKRFGELGLTQEQVEGVIGMMISQETENQSPESIMKSLDKNLTYEEKRSYKANCNLLKQALQGTQEEKLYNAITSDPTAVKILGRVISHIRGGANVNGARTQREVRNAGRMLTGEQAVNEFTKYMTANPTADHKAKKEELAKLLRTEEDKTYFKTIFE